MGRVIDAARVPRLWCMRMVWAQSGAARAQVTVNCITLPANIGLGQDVNVVMDWPRTSAAMVTISTPPAAKVPVFQSALPADRGFNALSVDCNVTTGREGPWDTITFQARGAAIGGFNLTAATFKQNPNLAAGAVDQVAASEVSVGKRKFARVMVG